MEYGKKRNYRTWEGPYFRVPPAGGPGHPPGPGSTRTEPEPKPTQNRCQSTPLGLWAPRGASGARWGPWGGSEPPRVPRARLTTLRRGGGTPRGLPRGREPRRGVRKWSNGHSMVTSGLRAIPSAVWARTGGLQPRGGVHSVWPPSEHTQRPGGVPPALTRCCLTPGRHPYGANAAPNASARRLGCPTRPAGPPGPLTASRRGWLRPAVVGPPVAHMPPPAGDPWEPAKWSRTPGGPPDGAKAVPNGSARVPGPPLRRTGPPGRRVAPGYGSGRPAPRAGRRRTKPEHPKRDDQQARSRKRPEHFKTSPNDFWLVPSPGRRGTEAAWARCCVSPSGACCSAEVLGPLGPGEGPTPDLVWENVFGNELRFVWPK